jgi:predicted metal-dependent enzyme (double-stranded beta helix superfamily)
MTTARYSLDEFIHDTKALMAREPDVTRFLNRAGGLLERLIRNPNCIPAHFGISPDEWMQAKSGTYLLYRDAERGEGLCVTAVIWGPGAHTGPHDHHTWGMIGVVENWLQETRFQRQDDGSRAGYARIVRDRINRNQAGDVTLLIPGTDEIHQMDNLTDRPTVEVHVYGRDLLGLERCRFNPDTGDVSLFMTQKYQNVAGTA